jgi:hypothetical protein
VAYSTIWKNIVEKAYHDSELDGMPALLDTVEQTQLAELFRKADDPTAKFVGAKKITLLDITRSRNIEILLGSLRVSYTAIKEAIINVNDEILNSERLSILMRCIPTDDEVQIIPFRLNYFLTLLFY